MVSFFLLKSYQLPTWSDLGKISVQGILLLCVANGLLTWSLEYINSGLAAIIAALVPLVCLHYSPSGFKCAKITRSMIVGLVIGLTGVLIIFILTWPVSKQVFIAGVILALLATLSWSFGTYILPSKDID